MNLSSVRDADGNSVTAEMLYYGYTLGCFPMADSREGAFAWYRPAERAIVTWDQLRCPRSLKKSWPADLIVSPLILIFPR